MRQFISYKSKILNKEIKKNLYLRGGLSSITSIIPFVDLIPAHYIQNNYKTYFLEQFGIQPIFNLIDGKQDIQVNETNVIKKDDVRWRAILEIKDMIEKSKVLDLLNTISSGEVTTDSIKTILIAIGAVFPSIADDVAGFVLRTIGYVITGALNLVLRIVGLVTIPVMMLIYCYFCFSAISKIFDEIVDFSIKIHDILHENNTI
jgi:hypothetical protein